MRSRLPGLPARDGHVWRPAGHLIPGDGFLHGDNSFVVRKVANIDGSIHVQAIRSEVAGEVLSEPQFRWQDVQKFVFKGTQSVRVKGQ